jgi:phosphatidylserine/phosphatidylglycerophosphate/cardiolipin synthase-like enzyme
MSAEAFRSGLRMLISLCVLALVLVSSIALSPQQMVRADGTGEVVINEVAWMGTTISSSDEWLELYNPGTQAVDLSGWMLTDGDDITITLSGTIPAQGYYLLERTNDDSVPGVAADQTYPGSLSNTGEVISLRDDVAVLVDEVPCGSGWFSGHADGRVPMVRVDPAVSGGDATNWAYNPRCGSATNSLAETHVCTLTTTTVPEPLEYQVYFNERATTATTTTTEKTTLEAALLGFLDRATATINISLYGLNRQSVVDSLVAAHNRGVTVRVVGDDDAATDEYASSYQALRNAGISVITDTSSYIQHNKFVVIDAQVVWTGSTNFTDTGLTLNANNGMVITSTILANTYQTEFEEMWSGLFHSDKADNTGHQLDYQGTLVESFFSPTDLVAFEVWNELAHLDESLHFAMFFWTDDLLTDRVIERLNVGAEVYGVWDALGAASPYSDDEILSSAGAKIRVEDFAGKVHHKFAIIDVHGSDPTVVLGSYNWTDSGAYDNDENTLIIHSAALAQAYYEEWKTLWGALGAPIPDHTVYLPLVIHETPTPEPTPSPEPPEPADIQITYIEFNPAGDDVQGEYVRIENQGGESQSLTNWTLRDEANHVFTFPNFSLGAGAAVQVWTKSGSNTTTDLYWGSGSAIWNNTGDTAYLQDHDANPVDTYTYNP